MLHTTFLTILSLISLNAFAASVTIEKFTPQNLTETTNQIRAVFSTKMVRLGADPNAQIFDLNCTPAVAGSAHWADEKSWVFDFKTPLTANKIPGGTRCKVGLKTGVKDLAGQLIKGKTSFQFQVDGPNLISIYPGDTNGVSRGGVASDQVFALGLDTEVDEASILRNAYFKIDGIASNIQLRILSEAEKLQVMKATNFPTWNFNKDLPLVMVQAKQVFPDNRRISFVWGKGISSTVSGISRQRDLVLPFASQPLFQASFSCERENARAHCSPFSDMTLNFNAEVPVEFAKQIRLVGADGKVIYPQIDKGDRMVRDLVFNATVHEHQSYRLELPAALNDEHGRALSNGASFPMTVKTADFPPLAKFAADFGILEANVKPILLPATLRNLEAQVIGKKLAPTSINGSSVRLSGDSFPEVIRWMKKLDVKENRASSLQDRNVSVFTSPSQGKPQAFNVPLKPNGRTFEVVGIPLEGPGFYVVELQSRLLGKSLLGKEVTMFVPSGALVTNMVVHSKWGKENSIFWVTELDSGMPVSGAAVAIYDCSGKIVHAGLETNAQGIAKLDYDLRSKIDPRTCENERKNRKSGEFWSSRYDHGFFVTAQRQNDFTFTHSGWNEGIEAFRFGNYSDFYISAGNDSSIAHTVLDRTLLRAGETVSMKHFMRSSANRGLALMPAAQLPNQVWVEHTDSGAREVAELKWDSTGTATSRFAISKDAKMGLYSITLVRANGANVVEQYSTSTFQVMQFKIPQMRGMITFPKDVQKLVQPGNLETNLSLTYQDGGPVPNQLVTFRYTVDRAYGLNFPNYSNYTFASEQVVERHGRNSDPDNNEKSVQVPVRLDSKGSALVNVPGLSGLTSVKSVTAQLEFTDSNSEVQNMTRTVNVFPASQLIGIQSDNTYSAKKSVRVNLVVVTLRGQPVSGVKPTFQAFERITYTHKTKMVGGFYSAENFTDINPVAIPFQCEGSGVTDKQGKVTCSALAPESGIFVVQAEVRDGNGHRSFASLDFYVSGRRRAWFPPDNNDRMDLISNQPEAQSGGDASFQVKMPFEQAKVLVTIEREGILDAFVADVSTHDPVLRVKVKPEYAPNVFVSALAVRGRVSRSDSDATATVDLGKPSFKLGLTSLNVNWRDHALKVDVKPNQTSYKPRENATVHVTVLGPGGRPAANAEFALAVVDKGLLQLAKNNTWDLLKSMMARRHLQVQTATAQMQVIGKRHFGLKARPTGGDGGSAPTRELFDTLVVWMERVKTDSNGKAIVNFKMNDSLSAFKLVAIAHQGVNQFGTGEAEIVTQQDITIIPAVAQLARNGDQYTADFTLRNSTKSPRTVLVSGRAQLIGADGKVQYLDLPTQSIALSAQGSHVVSLGQVKVPDDVVKIVYDVTARDSGQGIVDSIKITQVVEPSVLLRTWMAQLSQIDSRLAPIGIEIPKEARANQGGVSIKLMPSLTGSLTTVQDRLSSYPFMSLEYLISSAVARHDQVAWNAAMKKLPAYLDNEGLVHYYQNNRSGHGSDILTAYILSVAKYSGMKIPDDAESKMLNALTLFVQGKSKANRSILETPVDTYIRRVNGIEVLARYGVAESTWLSSLPQISAEQTPNLTLVNLLSIYIVLKDAPQRTLRLTEIQASLQGRLTRVGTGKKFNTLNVRCGFCMSSIDTDQLRLILVLAKERELWPIWGNELPMLVHAAVGMMNRGAWDLTVADTYGVLAMQAYSQAFENKPVNGVTTASLTGHIAKSWDWTEKPKGGVLDFGWVGIGTSSLGLNHNGQGTPWGLVMVKAAVPLTAKVERNISVTKETTPQQAAYKKGDLVTVTLVIKSQTTLSQVALLDPIPAGAKIEGSGLDNNVGNGPTGDLYPDSQVFANDGYHASFGVIPAESFRVVYRMRLNNTGTFKLPATRVEAIYAPENFAELPNADVTVVP